MKTTAASRLARRIGVAGAIAGSLAFASSAGAAVITVAPDNGTSTNNLGAAITTANTNADSSNTLILASSPTLPGPQAQWNPTAAYPPITKNLRITTDHSKQGANSADYFDIDGGVLATPPNTAAVDLFTVNAGITLSLDGMTFTSLGPASNTGNAIIRNNGTLNVNGVTFNANNMPSIANSATGTANLINTTVSGTNNTVQLIDNGTMTLINSTVSQGSAGGFSDTSTAKLNLYNTLVAVNNVNLSNTGKNCNIPATAQSASLDTDGSCAVTYSNIQTWGQGGANTFPPTTTNGGPTTTQLPAATDPTVAKGDATKCPIADQRFFGIPSGLTCDIGSVTRSAVRETTGPACPASGATFTYTNPPTNTIKKTMTVPVTSPTGFGPEQGALTDATTNAPADVVTNLTISNGTASLTGQPAIPFGEAPSSSVSVTATKTDTTLLTRWSFTATDWSGLSKFCN